MKKTTLSIFVSAITLSVFALTALSSCCKSLPLSCYDPVYAAQHKNDICTMELNPVKGCDGKTYSNPCQARSNGIKAYEPIGSL